MENIEIGKKIKELRKVKELTIKEVAEASDMSSSMLSQIERGLANPSITSLKTIAKVLEVPVFTFFINEGAVGDLVVRKSERKVMSFPSDNDFSYELLTPDLKGNIEFSLMTLNTGSQSSTKAFAHAGEEVALVIEGKVDLFINEKKIVLETGDSIRIPSQRKHRWFNHYDETCKVVFAINPPSF